MPRFNFSRDMAAGETFNFLNGWQYEYVPDGGVVKVNMWGEAAGMEANLSAGSDTLLQRSPVPVGATGAANIFPSEFDVTPIIDEVAAGDRLMLSVQNTTAGALFLTGYVDYVPGVGRLQ